MEPKSPEEWMRILRQQETIYRSTESKWLSALSSVNDHLKQTQDTLALLEVLNYISFDDVPFLTLFLLLV